MVRSRAPWAIGIASAVCAVAAILAAQNADSPSFEVASVKEAAPVPTGPSGPVSPDRFSQRFTTLSVLLVYAFDVTPQQLQGAPDWASSLRFDVEAKAAGPATTEQKRLMVRRLLAERFGMTAHIETKDLPRYALLKSRTDGRLGEKLRASSIDCPAIIAARGNDYRPPVGPPQPGEPPRCLNLVRMARTAMTMFFEGTPISQFARTLQGQAGRVIIDKTGLMGNYDIELTTANLSQPQTGDVGDAPSLFTAVQEQLGLKLESERGSVDVLVIDHVDHPTPD